MGVFTAQRLSDYYDRFRTVDTTFTKEVIQGTGLVTNQVMVKCGSDFFPCFIYSSSFETARVVVNLKSGIIRRLEEANNVVSLKFFFRPPATNEDVVFFVSCNSKGYTNYNNLPDQGFFTFQYKQRAPDDLVEIMGRILDANLNYQKRKTERIPLTADAVRKMKVHIRDVDVLVQGVPRRCILRELSFSGARIIIAGVPKFLLGKTAELHLEFDDPKESIPVIGAFTGTEPVVDRTEVVVMTITYADGIPMSYKLRLNDYLGTVKPDVNNLRPNPGAEGAPSAPEVSISTSAPDAQSGEEQKDDTPGDAAAPAAPDAADS